jgi:predicted transcriptional regulator
VTVTLDPRHIRQLKELAAKRKVSMAWLVRDAVERYLAPGPLFEDAVDRDRP